MSILGSYELCPYLTKERYNVIGEEYDESEEHHNIYSAFGVLLHELFEEWGRCKLRGDEFTESDMKALYDIKLTQLPVDFPEGKMSDWIYSGYQQIEYFYEKYAETLPVDVEHNFKELFIPGIDIPFSGTIDRIDGNPEEGYIDLKDYKTGNHTKYTKKELRDNIQATVYSLYAKEKYGFLPQTFTFVFTKTRKEKTITITEEFIERGIKRIMRSVNNMKQDKWGKTGNHTKYFCQNFCQSETCENRKYKAKKTSKPEKKGWGQFGKK